jgi:hypothetical protein
MIRYDRTANGNEAKNDKGFIVLAVMLNLASCAKQQQEASFTTGPLPLDYKAKVDKRLTEIMNDPDSRKVTFSSASDGIVCGTVNGKNKFGGYTGPQPFFATFLMSDDLRELTIVPPSDLHFYRGMIVADTHVRDMLRHFGVIWAKFPAKEMARKST